MLHEQKKKILDLPGVAGLSIERDTGDLKVLLIRESDETRRTVLEILGGRPVTFEIAAPFEAY